MGQFIDQDGFQADVDEDLRREVIDQRREQARAWHWCSVCHGHTGPGSPCYDGPEDEPEDDSEFCAGCNPEPTISELENGRCDSCGKVLA